MKLAFFGGTFNPLHLGHCAVADALIWDAHYDAVLFVVANEPSHKRLPLLSPSALSRFRMVARFCKSTFEADGKNRFIPEDAEIKRGGLSYTYDTLLYLYEKWNGKLDGKIGLVLGEEEIRQFRKWNRASDILEMCEIVKVKRRQSLHLQDSAVENVPRNGFVSDFRSFSCKNEDGFVKNYFQLENPYLDISSSMIRYRISKGLSFRYFLPSSVYADIVKNGYYGYKANF